MENQENKFDTINLVTYINEFIVQTEVTQYFKNTKQSPIELQMTIPKLSNNNLTKFEMTMKDKKVVSKLIENSKAKEKYTDAIASGNYGFLSYSTPEETTIFLGNIPPNEEITLKTFFFGHIISKDYSYQASFPVIFLGFIFINFFCSKKDYSWNISLRKIIFININFCTFIIISIFFVNFSKIFRAFYY